DRDRPDRPQHQLRALRANRRRGAHPDRGGADRVRRHPGQDGPRRLRRRPGLGRSVVRDSRRRGVSGHERQRV
ncbi:MAG: hypothetical protein AVDCRST_MAG87-851, partial [uncultured Thermomicrobiales bacterium]